MQQVYSAAHPTEAHYIKGLLETMGIACEVRGETLFSARGELPVTTDTAPSVWIYDNSRYAAAIVVVKEYEEQDPTPQKDKWTCSDCGEISEPQFSACWNCLKTKNS